MGKKNFIDKYDPFAAQIRRDEERITALGEKTAAEASPSPSPSIEKKAPVAEEVVVPIPPAKAVAAVARPKAPPEEDEDAEPAPPPRRAVTAPVAPPTAPRPRQATTSSLRERAHPRDNPPAQEDDDRTEASPRVKVSPAAFQDLQTTLSNFHRSTGSQVHYSIATRALWGLLIQAEAQIQEELKRRPLGRLPSTRDKLGYAAYEEHVKQIFAQAFRKLPRTLFQPIPENEAGEG